MHHKNDSGFRNSSQVSVPKVSWGVIFVCDAYNILFTDDLTDLKWQKVHFILVSAMKHLS